MAYENIIKIGTVVSLNDETGAGRIKVNIGDMDGAAKAIEDIPYSFPLLPKTIQSVPKIGEAVLILCTQSENGGSQRYYMGPIISQPQDMYKSDFAKGFGSATSTLEGAIVGPKEGIGTIADSFGAFPNQNDIALVGRKSEDIILKDNGIDIRCGIRKQAFSDTDPSFTGHILLNEEHPSYIQLKHDNNVLGKSGEGSVINMVADKINILSGLNTKTKVINKSDRSQSESDTSPKSDPLLHSEDILDLMNELHQLPYGDVLVKILNAMLNLIIEHTHNWAQMPTCQSPEVKEQIRDIRNNINGLLSNNVRIN